MAEKPKQKSQAGKGDKPRKVDGDKYRDNYDAIFTKPEPSSYEEATPYMWYLYGRRI